jgi:hypothetical protein
VLIALWKNKHALLILFVSDEKGAESISGASRGTTELHPAWGALKRNNGRTRARLSNSGSPR